MTITFAKMNAYISHLFISCFLFQTTMKALSSPYLNPSTASGQKCCPSGHPLQTDPVTGRSTCSCQLQQTTLPAYLSRVPSLPETIYAQGTSQLSLLQRHMAASALYQSQTVRFTCFFCNFVPLLYIYVARWFLV